MLRRSPTPTPALAPTPELSRYGAAGEAGAMHARCWVDPRVSSDPPIVLVHGLGVASRMCQPVARRLAWRHHVYAPDLPGFGDSDDPGVLDIDGHADALAAWMNSMHVPAATVAGTSLGCQVAAALAQRHPARCRLLVLGSPTVEAGRRSWWQQVPRWQVEQATQSLRLRAIQVSDYARAGARRVVRTFSAALDDRIEERLAAVRQPVLVCRATRDPLVSRCWAETLAATPRDGHLAVLPGAVHALSHENPLEFSRVISHFIDVDRPTRRRSERMMSPPNFIANFDSASAMSLATAFFLRGKPFVALGQSPAMKPLAKRANMLPKRAREKVFITSGAGETISPRRVHRLDFESVGEWLAEEYPPGPYPAVAVGSSSGALVHLYAALRIPWLPQTLLVPVRQRVHPDDPMTAMRKGTKYGRKMMDAFPDLQLHHMHDANQDRLMVRALTYIRVKRRALGADYERFLRERLEPGGTILVPECRRTWGTTQVGERHVFQHGALGGATEEEFHHGSERVAEYLERYDSPVRRWDGPEPDTEGPEAECGFAPALLDDIERFADEHGYRVQRLVFTEPEDPARWSPTSTAGGTSGGGFRPTVSSCPASWPWSPIGR